MLGADVLLWCWCRGGGHDFGTKVFVKALEGALFVKKIFRSALFYELDAHAILPHG